MSDVLSQFEKIVRHASSLSVVEDSIDFHSHPFDERNIHPEISVVSLKLFDDGHYSQATFEAFKFLDIYVKNLSGLNDSGHKLMMAAFTEQNPKIKLTPLTTSSDIDEQLGYRFIFAGAMSAIRNPRGHDLNIDTIDRCLDHLSLRRIETRVE